MGGGGQRGAWRLTGDHGVVCSDVVPGGAAERVQGGNLMLHARFICSTGLPITTCHRPSQCARCHRAARSAHT
jgi:hypothetical protein